MEATVRGFVLRLLGALALVLATYNPEGWSFSHWVLEDGGVTAPKAFAGVVLTIGWFVLFRAAFRSLGVIATGLAGAFVGTLLWLVIDTTDVGPSTARGFTYLVLFAIAFVLAGAASWSRLRRRAVGEGGAATPS
jgi:hypothetical protein